MKQRVVRSCVIVAALNPAVLAQAKFSILGPLAGGSGAIPLAVTADGTAVTGLAGTPTGVVAFHWTAATGMRELPHAPAGLVSSVGSGLSGNGRIIVGHGTTASLGVAVLWDERGAHLLPDLPGGLDDAAAIEVTPDGRVVVGCGFDSTGRVAVRWVDGKPESLAVPGQLRVGVADDVTPDGSRIVGIGGDDPEEAEGFLWNNGTVIGIGDLPGGRTHSRAVGVSRIGNVVVGTSFGEGTFSTYAVRWSAPTGLVNLGDIPGGLVGSEADAVSGDGRLIGGTSFTERGIEAMIWDPAHGMRSLPEVLQNKYGLNLGGWQLRIVNDMTPDGRIIVGEARAPGGSHLEPFMVHMPAYCYPDCNADDALTVADLTCFMSKYAATDYIYADCDNDDRLTLADFGCFTTKFALGCP